MVGVGIGNIAYRIKGMYNNSGMKIYSIKGHGTVIQIFLIIVVNKNVGGKLMYRVLLVDDEQIERMALAKKIDRYYGDKVNIYHAVNGREAVDMCSDHKMTLLLWTYPCLR